MKNILYIKVKIGTGIKSKNMGTYLRRYKSLFEMQETRFFVDFGQFPCPLIRIRIPNKDPGLRSRTVRIHADSD